MRQRQGLNENSCFKDELRGYIIIIDQLLIGNKAAMTERKPWTPQEDDILRKLFEGEKIRKWSEISKRMWQEFKLEGRSGKQCRERYHNHLKGGIRKEKWSPEEQDLLVSLHAELGNRWANISKLIPGRTENCVKNMLYSRMRKSVRQLNRFVHSRFRKELKPIKISFINRLIEVTESAYKQPENERNEQQIKAINIKNSILTLDLPEDLDSSEEQSQTARKLAQQIQQFKRVNQKHHRGVALAKIKKQKMKRKEDEDSLVSEHEEESQKEPKTSRTRLPRAPRKKTQNLQNKNEVQQQPPAMRPEEVKIEEEENLPEIGLAKKGVSITGSLCDPHVKEENPHRRSKVSVLRGDSLDNSFLGLLQDAGLQKPIQIDDYMHNMTPTPRYSNLLDWVDAGNGWKLPFLYQ